ncbi:unnamed protein product [Linum trigynum]|uniref:Uncharacterized protein n=1 Tax=Linum trigynum TaxID=586398 RepID=A0AAV2E2G0_9ROSI
MTREARRKTAGKPPESGRKTAGNSSGGGGRRPAAGGRGAAAGGRGAAAGGRRQRGGGRRQRGGGRRQRGGGRRQRGGGRRLAEEGGERIGEEERGGKFEKMRVERENGRGFAINSKNTRSGICDSTTGGFKTWRVKCKEIPGL